MATVPVLAPQPPKNPFLCNVGHPLEIEPVQVLAALGEFVGVFTSDEKEKLNEILDYLKPGNYATASRTVAPEQIEQYWAGWQAMYPPSKDNFWDGMVSGLQNYLTILQDRLKLHEEVSSLRQRNVALRRLLHGALPPLPPAARHYQLPAPRAFTAPGFLPSI